MVRWGAPIGGADWLVPHAGRVGQLLLVGVYIYVYRWLDGVESHPPGAHGDGSLI